MWHSFVQRVYKLPTSGFLFRAPFVWNFVVVWFVYSLSDETQNGWWAVFFCFFVISVTYKKFSFLHRLARYTIGDWLKKWQILSRTYFVEKIRTGIIKLKRKEKVEPIFGCFVCSEKHFDLFFFLLIQYSIFFQQFWLN